MLSKVSVLFCLVLLSLVSSSQIVSRIGRCQSEVGKSIAERIEEVVVVAELNPEFQKVEFFARDSTYHLQAEGSNLAVTMNVEGANWGIHSAGAAVGVLAVQLKGRVRLKDQTIEIDQTTEIEIKNAEASAPGGVRVFWERSQAGPAQVRHFEVPLTIEGNSSRPAVIYLRMESRAGSSPLIDISIKFEGLGTLSGETSYFEP